MCATLYISSTVLPLPYLFLLAYAATKHQGGPVSQLLLTADLKQSGGFDRTLRADSQLGSRLLSTVGPVLEFNSETQQQLQIGKLSC